MHTIRPLTATDADAYALLRAEMIAAEKYAFLGVPGDDDYTNADHVRRHLAHPEQLIFGAFDGATLVATVGISREQRVKRRHRAHVWGVYTTRAARGHGVSRRLMTAALDLARTWGVAVVDLTAAHNSAAAISLYTSLGFVTWGTQPDCTRVQGEPVTELHMQVVLEPGATA